MVLTKVMEMLEKQLRPTTGLRAKQQANTMKSMKIAHKKKMQRTSVQIYKSDRGISKSRSFAQCCSVKKKTRATTFARSNLMAFHCGSALLLWPRPSMCPPWALRFEWSGGSGWSWVELREEETRKIV